MSCSDCAIKDVKNSFDLIFLNVERKPKIILLIACSGTVTLLSVYIANAIVPSQ